MKTFKFGSDYDYYNTTYYLLLTFSALNYILNNYGFYQFTYSLYTIWGTHHNGKTTCDTRELKGSSSIKCNIIDCRFLKRTHITSFSTMTLSTFIKAAQINIRPIKKRAPTYSILVKTVLKHSPLWGLVLVWCSRHMDWEHLDYLR